MMIIINYEKSNFENHMGSQINENKDNLIEVE